MEDIASGWIWGIGLLSFALGASSGLLVAMWLPLNRRRVRELEAELEQVRTAFGDYRGEVDGHFLKTSELFQGLTTQYRAVYEHLANGAQRLCSPDLQAPRLDLPERQVLPGAEAEARPAPPPEAEVAAHDHLQSELESDSATHPAAAPIFSGEHPAAAERAAAR